MGFAAIVGTLTTRQLRSDFNDQVRSTADDLAKRVIVRPGEDPVCSGPDLDVYGSAENAQIRVVTLDGVLLCQSRGTPDFGLPRNETVQSRGFRVESRLITVPPLGRAVLQYARPDSDVDHTAAKVRVFLGLGVIAGAALALLAGLAVARRAMRPIAELTGTAREIERTRDPSRRVPHPEAEDEVAELARTLEGMLMALDAARSDTEAMLQRQRRFVADASHELRTPLTSVLANLEFLAARLEPSDESEAARSALRSSQRMKRLVADLLLLARADAGRRHAHTPTDVATVLTEAAAELEPISHDHDLELDARPATVDGVPDDLHRMAANLIENAICHTPPGTSVRAAVRADGDAVVLSVTDDGPGIAPELAPRVFERFVRGGGEGAGSSGLGLAIVRAVSESHGGTVTLESPAGDGPGGTRFVVRLPRSASAPAQEPAAFTAR